MIEVGWNEKKTGRKLLFTASATNNVLLKDNELLRTEIERVYKLESARHEALGVVVEAIFDMLQSAKVEQLAQRARAKHLKDSGIRDQAVEALLSVPFKLVASDAT